MWTDPETRKGPHAPGFAMMGADIYFYFPISPNLAVVGAFDVGNTILIEATIAVANSCMKAVAHRQVYASDHKFSYAQTREEVARTGSQLISDKRFPRKVSDMAMCRHTGAAARSLGRQS
jgi:hypothetical protein